MMTRIRPRRRTLQVGVGLVTSLVMAFGCGPGMRAVQVRVVGPAGEPVEGAGLHAYSGSARIDPYGGDQFTDALGLAVMDSLRGDMDAQVGVTPPDSPKYMIPDTLRIARDLNRRSAPLEVRLDTVQAYLPDSTDDLLNGRGKGIYHNRN